MTTDAQAATATPNDPDAQAAPGDTDATTTDAAVSEPKMFDEAYVKKLRQEAAGSRTEANELKARLQEIEDREKSEQQKLTERAEAAERAAAENAERLMRFEVAADKGLEPKYAALLTGSREDMEAKADLILEAKTPAPVDPAAFDGGVRTTSSDAAGLTPTQAHTVTLKQLFGRT